MARGNPGRRPILSGEPRPAVGVPTPPRWVNAAGRREWRRIVPELRRLGLIAKLDRDKLGAYCMAVVRYGECEKIIDREGLLVTGREGEPVRNPAVFVLDQAARRMDRFGALFGMSPSDRVRLATGGAADKDELDEFVKELKVCRSGEI